MDTKICSKCKTEKSVGDFNKHEGHKDGLRSECKKCFNEWKKKYRIKNNEKIRQKEREWENRYGQRPYGKFLYYKKKAKERTISWNLSFEQFLIFWQKPCNYCSQTIKTIGLDRINNERGYEINNIVPCCKTCNYAKRALKEKEFIEMCNRVSERHK